MISYTTGNLLESDVEALVNTVNTVGVMGKGIALMFKKRFPVNYTAYVHACKEGRVQTGRMFVTETGELVNPRWVVNFPTKQHWRDKSQMQWVIDGLADLRSFIKEYRVGSIAIPALGAGNGGLEWIQVKPIERQLTWPVQRQLSWPVDLIRFGTAERRVRCVGQSHYRATGQVIYGTSQSTAPDRRRRQSRDF